VSAGATAPQQLTLTNSGTQTVDLSALSVTGTNASQFQRLSGGATDCAAGTALAGGETCNVRVRFRPTSAGAKTASVTVVSNAGDDLVTPLSGTGTPAPRLTIPTFQPLASSTAHKKLKVAVAPVGGTIRNIVVEIRSSRNQLLGTGRLGSASVKRTVVVTLRHALAAGHYVANGRGTDAFGHRVSVTRKFTLVARRARRNGGGGGGGGGSAGGGGG
jgi:methionine-rich copper-binding protein CopC